MSFSARDLLEEQRGKPISISADRSLRDALELMFKYGYSQLPVVAENNIPLGIITTESILRALHSLSVTLDALKVSAAVVKTREHTFDGDLFELLNDLQQYSVVLIVNAARQLEEIVTGYDATRYLRQRAEDMMRVEDIESTLKDHIESAFADKSGALNEDELKRTIQDISENQQNLQGRFKGALRKYLELQGGAPVQPDPTSEKEALAILEQKAPEKKLADLTLYDYVQLLLHRKSAEYYGRVFDIERSILRNMLEGVNKTRNIIAHFKGELTAGQQEQLRFCAEWFNRHPASIAIDSPQPVARATVLRESNDSYEVSSGTEVVTPTDEEIGPDDSRYARLALWLRNQPAQDSRVRLTFPQIEQIIGGKLPPSARQHRAWWANDSVAHVQSQQWLDAGWRVSHTNIPEEQVVFARIEGRERAYIDFFGALVKKLRETRPFPLKTYDPKGQSWHIVAAIPERGPQLSTFVFSFALGKRFRTELYIDTTDRERNKKAFHHLLEQRSEIESQTGPLAWEELPDRRASRIAAYRAGSVTDDDQALVELREWAVPTMLRFHTAIAQKATEALSGPNA